MRTIISLSLIALLSAAGAAQNLVPRQAGFCSNVKRTCTTDPYSFCYGYLDVHPVRSTTRITVSTVTVTTDYTAGTETTTQCPTHGGAARKKRDGPAILDERGPKPTPFIENATPRLEKRAAPPCLRKYTTNSSQLSKACNCYDYPVTSSTRTIYRTTTLPGAPTTTKYTRTVTITSVAPKPTCAVSSTDKNTGQKLNWTKYYGVCFAFRSGGNFPRGDYVFDPSLPLCEALNKCASVLINADSSVKTFELSFNEFQNRPGGPRWDCRGYGAGPTPLELFPAENWYETYGYYHN